MGNARSAHAWIPPPRLRSWSVCRNCVVLFTPSWHLQQASCRRLQRSLTERFFCGNHRNRERWLVIIYRSMTQCCQMGLAQTETARGPAQKTLLHPWADPLCIDANVPVDCCISHKHLWWSSRCSQMGAVLGRCVQCVNIALITYCQLDSQGET